MLLDVRPDHLKVVQDILQRLVPDREVWAFGSRAKWLAKEYSDLDLCVLGETPLGFRTLGLLEEAFDESDLPYKVDVVDWATTSEAFRRIIERDKVVIQQANASAWPFVRLGDHCEKIGSGATPKGGKEAYLSSGSYRLIRSQNIYNDGFKYDGLAYISEEQAKKLDGVAVQAGDVLLNITGDSVARVCSAPSAVLPARVNQHVAIIRPAPSDLDAKFIRYYLACPQQQDLLLGLASAGATRNALTKGMIEALFVPQPPMAEQKAIAETLSSLDDKIALLRETNATLEAIAQALFKSWFVDFDPVRAKMEGRQPQGMDKETAALFPDSFEDSELCEIPKGWKIVSVDDVADVIKGRSYKSSELADSDTALVTLKSFARGGGFRTDGFKGYTGSYKNEQVIRPGDCVVAYTDVTQQAEVIGRAAMVLPSSEHTTLVASLDVGIVRPKIEHLTTAFLYFLLRGERYVSHIFGFTSGTTVLHLAKDGLPTYKFVLPPASLLQTFEEVVIPMMEQMAGNYLQTIELVSLRDTLLPRLMSGKIVVPNGNNPCESCI